MAFEPSAATDGTGPVGHVVHVLSQDWVARYEISGRDEGLAISGINVIAVNSDAICTPSVLQQLAPVRALAAATNRAWWATADDGVAVGVVGRGMATIKGPGRPRHPLSEIAKTAQSYVRELNEPKAGSAIDRVAENRHLTRRQVQSHLRRARDEGLMTSTTRGKAAGEITKLGRWHLSTGSAQADPIAEHAANPEMFASEPKGPFFEAGINAFEKLKWDRQAQLDHQRER